jgi:hypothetical protein
MWGEECVTKVRKGKSENLTVERLTLVVYGAPLIQSAEGGVTGTVHGCWTSGFPGATIGRVWRDVHSSGTASDIRLELSRRIVDFHDGD